MDQKGFRVSALKILKVLQMVKLSSLQNVDVLKKHSKEIKCVCYVGILLPIHAFRTTAFTIARILKTVHN